MRAKNFWGLLFFLAGLGAGPLCGQENPYADSLKSTLTETMPDTLRVLTLCDLAFAYYNSRPEEAEQYARRAVELARQISYTRGLMKAYYSLAASLLTEGRYEEAIEASEKSLEEAKRLGRSSAIRGIYNLQGVIYRQWGQLEEALKPLFVLLKISEEEGDMLDAGLAAENISTVYLDLQDSLTARTYALRAEQYFVKADAAEYLPDLYVNLSSLTKTLSDKLAYLKKAQKLGISGANPYIYHNLGAYYQHAGRQDSVLYYYQKGLESARETGDRYEELQLLLAVSEEYRRQKNYSKALAYAREGMDLAKALDQKQTLGGLYVLSGQVQAALGQYDSAYYSANRALGILDTFFTADLKQAQAEALARYEYEKQKARIAEQDLEIERSRRRRQELLFVGLALLLLLGGLSYFFWMRQRIKAEKDRLLLKSKQEEAQRLQELHELKARFFNNIAHEYRTPLTLILAPLEDLIGKLKDRDTKERLLEIEEQGRRLLQLTEEMLELARLDSGSIPLKEHPLQLAGSLQRICTSYESAARMKGVSWQCEIHCPPGLIVRLDEGKLEKILNNLLGNALKFTPSGKCVQLQAEVKEGCLKVVVHNEGPGISKADLPHIFERFYRGGQKESGAGIGLAFAKELCDLMGGSIRAESEEGVFARFVLELPVREVSGAELETKSRAPSTRWEPHLGHGKEAVILIVEDQPDMARFLQQLLSEEYHTLHASEGKQALEILRKQKVDLIISDVMMPGGMDGFAFRQMVAREEAWKFIPFVFLTARAAESDRLRGFRFGADDYIVKPFSVRELRARLRSLLEKKREREAALREQGLEQDGLTADEEFLAQAERLVLEHLDEPGFGVEELAAGMNYSSRQLARLLKELTGLSPVQFLLEIRLQRAYQLLKSKRYRTVSEVRYAVGIESASYFSKKFSERFGVRPSEL